MPLVVKGVPLNRTVRRLALGSVALAALLLAAPGAQSRDVARGPAPTFVNYHEPGEEEGGGEPTLGVNWKTGTVLYQSNLRTMAITFDARDRARWEERSFILESSFSLDPILYTDPVSGRTFVSQLAAACSLMSFTDDDGKTWQPSQGCGPGAFVDHQTVGAGPYSSSNPLASLVQGDRPLAVYYCAQAVAEAACARSDDGGTTFGAGVPIYNYTQCRGFHGHLRVAPDGTVYVPNMGCGSEQAAIVSEDNGLTWHIRKIPGTEVNGESDPSVAAGSDNTVYFGFQNGKDDANTQAKVAVSRDRGKTWSKPVDVSSRLGIKNVQFPHVIAGDGDRAAFAFLGTKTGGNDQTNEFDGDWRLYIATTYDRGATWTTVNATPHELVQRGCIQLTGCNHRNLLDFNDIAVDKQGRVLVAWADGCPVTCERGAKWDADWHSAVITRQNGGKGLFRAYDGRW